MVQEWPQISDGVPTFLGVEPARSVADLRGADVAIIGVPYMTPMFGFDADLTPRKVREASTRYAGTYLPEFDLDVGAALRIVDYGDAPIDRDDLALVFARRHQTDPYRGYGLIFAATIPSHHRAAGNSS